MPAMSEAYGASEQRRNGEPDDDRNENGDVLERCHAVAARMFVAELRDGAHTPLRAV